MDDGEKYFEQEKKRNEEQYSEGDRYAQEPRVKGEQYEDEEDRTRPYEEAPKMRPYDDGFGFKNEKPISSSNVASANRGAMKLLMNLNHKVKEKQDPAVKD